MVVYMPLGTRTYRQEQTIQQDIPNYLWIGSLENSNNLSVFDETDAFRQYLICRVTQPVEFLVPSLKNNVARRKNLAGTGRYLWCNRKV